MGQAAEECCAGVAAILEGGGVMSAGEAESGGSQERVMRGWGYPSWQVTAWGRVPYARTWAAAVQRVQQAAGCGCRACGW